MYGDETWTLRKVNQKHLESFEMWWCRRTDVRNEEVLHTVKRKRNIVHTIQRRKAKWIGHILRGTYLLKHDVEGEIEEGIELTGRQERRCKQSLDDL